MIFEGKSVFSGIAMGKIHVYGKKEHMVKRVKVQSEEQEVKRFVQAKEEAKTQLQQLYDKALRQVGEANAMIFEVHQMMLDDLDYTDSIAHMIRTQGINAEVAVANTADNFAAMFSQMDDAYMKERAADVKDISNRVIAILQGQDKGEDLGEEPVIILAEDLAPSETIQLDKEKVLSFVTIKGSTNSHTAILARTMNIPALVGTKIEDSLETFHGKRAIVDGNQGKIIIEPTPEVWEEYLEKKQEQLRKLKLLQELKGKANETKDGKEIQLYANIGNSKDVASVLANDGHGIGLFRSEFLYLESEDFPTEEQQFQAYKLVAETMAGKKVIIRTLDLGADKQVEYFDLGQEENPAMGYRAIRICLSKPDIFKTQLRAILRASFYGQIAIMFPMIISLEEVQQAKRMLEEVKQELTQEGLPYQQVEIGVMIETPAAVMISDLLAEEVDFFSIGTNDLTQYTLAIDRQNPKLDEWYDPHHPAILRMISTVIENGHKHGCWVGICGELGGDTSLTETLIQMGIDELSVTPSVLLSVREAIRNSVSKA